MDSNAFDQFDAPASPGNALDQFDTSAQTANAFDQFDASPETQPAAQPAAPPQAQAEADSPGFVSEFGKAFSATTLPQVGGLLRVAGLHDVADFMDEATPDLSENKGAKTQIAHGAGSASALLAEGVAARNPFIPAISAGLGAYENAYKKTFGETEDRDKAQHDARVALLKTAPEMVATVLGVTGGAGAVKMLVNKFGGGKIARAIGAAIGGGAGGQAVTSAIAKIEGHDPTPTIESVTTNAIFGAAAGVHEAMKAEPEKALESIGAETPPPVSDLNPQPKAEPPSPAPIEFTPPTPEPPPEAASGEPSSQRGSAAAPESSGGPPPVPRAVETVAEAPTSGGIRPETVAAPKIVPSAQALGVTHPLPGFLNDAVDALMGAKLGDKVRGFFNRLKGTLGTVAGETFPNITIADRKAGELAARWISSKIAAPFLSRNFSDSVLEGTGIDSRKFGTALTEDNLRSVRRGFEEAQQPERADKVGTTIGGKNSPFKTEADYQAFLKDAAVQAALERHRSLWGEVVEPMYKQAMLLEPDTELASRGEQTGARINLNAVREGDPMRGKVVTVGQGNPLATLRRKSPFGREATGTGTYDTDYHAMMANTFARQLEIANKNAFETHLVETQNAVIGKPGEAPLLPDGEETVGFPLKRQTLVLKGEGGTSVVPQSQVLYVRKSLAKEYKRGANADSTIVPEVVQKVGGVLNRAALAGLTDATVHITNLSHVLFNSPGATGSVLSDSLLSSFGRADVPVALTKAVVKAFQDNRAQLTRLAEIGALREQHPQGASWNPLARMSDAIQYADRAVRLVMDDTFTRLAKDGLVEDTETNRREFINQVGQYNKRAQGNLMRFFRDSGLGPFATAGRTFNVLGAKRLALSPGATATSGGAAAALRANVLAKWVGATVLVGTANYLLTKDKGGGVLGRPGVKLGHIDTGTNDENGRPLAINAMDLVGLGRGLRVTGIRGAVEAKRNGLTNSDVLDSAGRDVINSAISPFAGPVVKFGAAIINQPVGVGIPKPAPIVAPGESQLASNVEHAVIEANPLVASVVDLSKPGQGKAAAIRRQFPRFTLQPSNPPEMMEHYPEIVHKAQASAFIDDVIGRARKMEPAARQKFIDESLARLKPEDRENALNQMRRRRVLPKKPKAIPLIKRP